MAVINYFQLEDSQGFPNIVPTAKIDLNIVMTNMEKVMEQREVFLDNFEENVVGSRPISKTGCTRKERIS